MAQRTGFCNAHPQANPEILMTMDGQHSFLGNYDIHGKLYRKSKDSNEFRQCVVNVDGKLFYGGLNQFTDGYVNVFPLIPGQFERIIKVFARTETKDFPGLYEKFMKQTDKIFDDDEDDDEEMEKSDDEE